MIQKYNFWVNHDQPSKTKMEYTGNISPVAKVKRDLQNSAGNTTQFKKSIVMAYRGLGVCK